ncbi:MAG: hypothetical protein Q4C75_05590, partial [Bergeyella zoohelcum]|nr:hypothetical protein [Bergeyella zoohelcum]
MKSILKWSLVLTMAITTTHCSRDEEPTVVNGTDGKDGVDGKNGSVIHSGEGTPATSLGSVGDFYFDKKAQALYGPKTSNGWGEPTSLKGKDGTNGTNGSQILSGT